MTGDDGATGNGGAAPGGADRGGWAPRLVANAANVPEESHKRVACPHGDVVGHGATLVVWHPTVLSSPAVSFIAQGMVAACAGEDLDLVLETLPMASEEQAHKMTWQKSGSLVAMACQVGAATAMDDLTILELVGSFGAHVGVVAQLLNDIAGVDPDEPERGSDLRRKKKTLPIAYALRCASEEDLSTVLNWSQSTTPLSDQEATHLAMIMRDLGALHYTWVVADTHRREALAVVQELVKLTERHEVHGLRRLIPAVRARRTRNTVR